MKLGKFKFQDGCISKYGKRRELAWKKQRELNQNSMLFQTFGVEPALIPPRETIFPGKKLSSTPRWAESPQHETVQVPHFCTISKLLR